jgi:glutamate/aspartate transport system substrate-binding protein
MGINASLAQTIKELDMQLRKLATAMLVMGMSAGLAHAEDAAPRQAARWIRSPKMA